MLNKGDIVIATETREGFVKGDTLKINFVGFSKVDGIAKNLTRPNYNGIRRPVVLAGNYIKTTKSSHIKVPTKKVYFLGIPIFTVKDVRNAEN